MRNTLDASFETHTIALKACNPTRNVFRFYRLSLEKDLFGAWVVTSCYGRMGSKGTIKRKSDPSYGRAKRIYDRILKKRLHAKARLGCDYEIASPGIPRMT